MRKAIIRERPAFTLAGAEVLPKMGMVTTIAPTRRKTKMNVSISLCGYIQHIHRRPVSYRIYIGMVLNSFWV
jgi:hypothetical protein